MASALIGLFDRVRGDTGEILFDIPRATCVRIAQPAHDFQKPFDPGGLVIDQRAIGHCSAFRFGV